ncbi:MAG: citramalate synthase [Clostridia bacterium]
MAKKIYIYDTTLRDGSQGEGISFSVEDKIKITQRLDGMGVDFIEGGWPGSNPKDMDYFLRMQSIPLKHAKVAAFGSTRRPNSKASDDDNLKMFVASGVSIVTIFGKTWDFHVIEALGTTLEENLAMISESVEFLKANNMRVFYDAEHFFDGYKANKEYAIKTLQAAEAAGAEYLCLCDTNGGTLPLEITNIMQELGEYVKIPLGIHCHNDSGLAIANTIMAVDAGAKLVQGTINGFGERCGNVDLCVVLANLEIKMGYSCLPKGNLKQLTELSHFVYEIANIAPQNNQPFVGNSAFAHKGGIHVSAVLKNPATYEHVDHEIVGNKRRVLVSELSGISNLNYKSKELGLELPQDKVIRREIVKEIKNLEYEGYSFEGAEGSLELLMRKHMKEFKPKYTLDSMHVWTEKNGKNGVYSEATLKIKVDKEIMHTAADGNGPVNALDIALRKALLPYYPEIAEMQLVDYKVRVLDEKSATGAKVRVLIESKDHTSNWTTIGVSSDIIAASWHALVDSMDFYLMKLGK